MVVTSRAASSRLVGCRRQRYPGRRPTRGTDAGRSVRRSLHCAAMASLRPGDDAGRAWRDEHVRRPGDRRRHHRRRDGARRRQPRACAPPWSSATTSRPARRRRAPSSIHGGLRYLQQGDVRLVYEALAERQRLRRNAPHLVRILPFMIPILTRDGVMNAKIARAFGSALWMYDLTGGARIGKLHRRLNKDAALAHMPTMPADRLASAYLYYDARADDARLCLTVARTAAAHGAVVLNGAARRRASTRTRRAGRPAPASRSTAQEVDVRRRASWSTPPACGPTRCGPSTKACTRTPSGRPRASTSPSRGRRCATTSPSSSPCRRTSAACSSCRGGTTPTSAPPTPTTTARSTTRSARPRTSPTCCGRSTTR